MHQIGSFLQADTMNKSLSPISDPRNESVEVSRRLYRNLMDTTRQLDEIRSHAKTTGDLFSVEAQVLRNKLKEIAERLVFSSLLSQRRKVEEVLWRKGFYEDVSTAKRLRKDCQWMPDECSQLLLHIKCGIGFYHHLLQCLQIEYGITSGCIDFPMVFPDQDYGKSKLPPSSKQLEAARDSVHRCLVCLGDLNRYLMDIPQSGSYDMAYRYYHQALSWNPAIGMPHNQLGTLSLSTNCNLDAVYYYMRCLMCSQPFEGAEGNLKRSLERSALKVHQEKAVSCGSALWRCVCSNPGEGQLSEAQDHIQQFLAHFLLLADLWFFDKKPVANVSDLCHQTLLDFRLCLSFVEPPESEATYFTRSRENFPSHLSKDMVLKVVVVSLICLLQLRKKGSDHVSSLVAFLLAVFCILVQQVQEHFVDSVLNLSLPTVEELNVNAPKVNGKCSDTDEIAVNDVTECRKENGHHDSINGNAVNGETEEAIDTKPKRRKRVVRRRQRQCDSSDDSDEEFNIGSGSSDISEDEEIVLDLSSDEEGLENRKENDDNDDDVVVLEEIESLAKSVSLTNGHTGKHIQLETSTQEPANPADVLEQVCGESLLPAIKVCIDWLQGDKPVVEACGKDSLDVLKKLVDLVNFVNIDMKDLEKDATAASFLKHRSIFESKCKIPLPEDVQLQKLSILASAHENLDWELIRQNRLNPKEEALLRTRRLVSFCDFLQSVPETGVKYDEVSHKFSVCKETKDSGQPVSPGVDLQRREEVMHNMGQLWLRAEVQNLETSVKRGSKGASFSPYLVLDVDALTKYCQLVGQLMASRKFIMVVPSIVLSALDQLKRESVLARDAIRWLEFQFQKGSRFLRAQTSHEALRLPLVSYPKQKAREAWSYFQVLECCHYLNHQSSLSYNKDSRAGFVTLLTGHDWMEANGFSGFSPIGVSKAIGISIEHIESFFTKWKTSSKSHG
ncbi:protein SMG5 isoform X2 [Thrips palmi]|uniref:Protein SMG5 isoform X2 n=1 Tax=Thrips palmi TaxID=161013 RepID=A0A6P8YVV6_THRPL|nr:protein SMG5 isoform X2 [Thrips palmi]